MRHHGHGLQSARRFLSRRMPPSAMLTNARSIRIRVISCTSADELPDTRERFKRADGAKPPVVMALRDASDQNRARSAKC